MGHQIERGLGPDATRMPFAAERTHYAAHKTLLAIEHGQFLSGGAVRHQYAVVGQVLKAQGALHRGGSGTLVRPVAGDADQAHRNQCKRDDAAGAVQHPLREGVAGAGRFGRWHQSGAHVALACRRPAGLGARARALSAMATDGPLTAVQAARSSLARPLAWATARKVGSGWLTRQGRTLGHR